MSATVLDRILADKRRRLERRRLELRPAPSRPAAGRRSDGEAFLRALRAPGTRVIAEIKARSPSAGQILADPESCLAVLSGAYRRGGAAAISVVTEEDHFGGKGEWIASVREVSGLSVLMKDFIVSERQLDDAVALGADAILLIVGALDGEALRSLRGAAGERGLAVVVEAHGAEEVRRATAVAPDVVGVNARDLRTFAVDHAALRGLADGIPEGIVRLAESGIAGPEDVARLRAAGYGAFLVGESLLRSSDPEEALRRLRS